MRPVNKEEKTYRDGKTATAKESESEKAEIATRTHHVRPEAAAAGIARGMRVGIGCISDKIEQ